jgi:hypothetical protein
LRRRTAADHAEAQTVSCECCYLSESLGVNASSTASIEALYGQECDFRFADVRLFWLVTDKSRRFLGDGGRMVSNRRWPASLSLNSLDPLLSDLSQRIANK